MSTVDLELFQKVEAAKREWEVAFDAIEDAIYIVDENSRILRANLAFAQLLGMDIRDLIGRTCCEFFPHHKEMGCPAKVQGRRSVEFKFDGPPRRFYQESVHPIMHSNNKVVVVTDITSLKLAELRLERMAQEAIDNNKKLESMLKKLRETQQKLIESEKLASLAVLAGRLAHEINNPLSFILSNVRVLGKYCKELIGFVERGCKGFDRDEIEFLKEDWVAAQDDAIDGVERIKKIIVAIEQFVGRDELLSDVDLVDVVREVLSGVDIPEYIEIEEKLEPVKPIKGMRNAIVLALRNLIENALNAVEGKKDGRIIIEVGENDIGPFIVVKDNGMGMDDETLKRAKDPFYTTKAPGPHIGMGLSIAYGIIQRHGGELILESEKDKGTMVTMQFVREDKEVR